MPVFLRRSRSAARRVVASLALMAMAALAAPAGIPPEWSPADYPARAQANWWGVEVARFPSRLLASGVEQSLLNYGWGPVILSETADGQTSVVVGEMQFLGDAWFLAEEMRVQRLAEPRIVPLPISTTGRAPRGYSAAPLLPPFTPSTPRAALATPGEDAMRTAVERLMLTIDDETRLGQLRSLLSLWAAGNFNDPALGTGAVVAARSLWDKMVEPEVSLFLAGRVARGEWAAPTADRLAARELMADLLYGHRRDWRAAWIAARELEVAEGRDPVRRSMDRLRQAALMVEIFQRGVEPVPTMADVRLRLRRAHEGLPVGSSEAERRIHLVYIQTFAWEGDWSRVETLARAYLRDHAAPGAPATAHAALARVLLAQSLERHERYDEALRILSEVINTPIPAEERLRLGVTTRDITEEARVLYRRFQQLALADVPASMPVVPPTPKAPAEGTTEAAGTARR
jgi:hypothetical protein